MTSTEARDRAIAELDREIAELDKKDAEEEKIRESYTEYLCGGFECNLCHRKFSVAYENERRDSWGNQWKWNFRGAKANMIKHVKACLRKRDGQRGD
jgi:hypothetical protein